MPGSRHCCRCRRLHHSRRPPCIHRRTLHPPLPRWRLRHPRTRSRLHPDPCPDPRTVCVRPRAPRRPVQSPHKSFYRRQLPDPHRPRRTACMRSRSQRRRLRRPRCRHRRRRPVRRPSRPRRPGQRVSRRRYQLFRRRVRPPLRPSRRNPWSCWDWRPRQFTPSSSCNRCTGRPRRRRHIRCQCSPETRSQAIP